MKRGRQVKGAFDLIEEAVHLLRTAPLSVLAVYYLGAIPFVLGFLYFLTDMSRNPFAADHLASSTLGMAGLFVWMKFWQVAFARRLRAHIAVQPTAHWTFHRWTRSLLRQAFVQPSGLFIIPLSIIPILPAGWVFGFYQNISALDDGGPEGVGALLKKSWTQATLWPRQNLLVLAILAAFGSCIFLNWVAAGVMLPHLIKMLLGVESVFTRDTVSTLNTTFFAGAVGLTYLSVDPIVKAIYILRCFYGESLASGEDLRAQLNCTSRNLLSIAAAIVILLSLADAKSVSAAGTNAPVASLTAALSSSVRPGDLDHAISQTIREEKYTWRMPRQKPEDDAKEGVMARFFDKAGAMLRQWARSISHWLDEWLRKLFRPGQTRSASSPSGYGWIESLQILLYGLVAVVLSALAILLYRVWQNRTSSSAIASEPIEPTPDLQDESVGADELPEDGWSRLAGELLARGELRLALRAFYFASLAHLSVRNLIRIARFKSNRDYECELRRRGHSFPGLVSAFNENLRLFERIWYGLHEVNREMVDHFAANVERIKSIG